MISGTRRDFQADPAAMHRAADGAGARWIVLATADCIVLELSRKSGWLGTVRVKEGAQLNILDVLGGVPVVFLCVVARLDQLFQHTDHMRIIDVLCFPVGHKPSLVP